MMDKTAKPITPKLQVEALLFSSGKTMTEEQLSQLAKLDMRTVKKALANLQKEYQERDSAVTIFNDDTGWKMMVRELYIPTVKNIVAETELSRACMETLAVIAYKYPKVLQSEVIDIRGSGAYEHMAELEKLGFIAREPSGRSYAVKLTEKFFNYFDVAGGKDIREVFKGVKVPDKVGKQQTLGQMPIVDMPPEAPEETFTPQTTPLPREDHSAFLDDLDERIARLQNRNDVNEKHESLKRKPLPGMEEASETQETSGNTENSENENSQQ